MSDPELEDNHDFLEREKLRLDIERLKRPWWLDASYVSALSPMIVALVVFLAALMSGFFDQRRDVLNSEIEKLQTKLESTKSEYDRLNAFIEQEKLQKQALTAIVAQNGDVFIVPPFDLDNPNEYEVAFVTGFYRKRRGLPARTSPLNIPVKPPIRQIDDTLKWLRFVPRLVALDVQCPPFKFTATGMSRIADIGTLKRLRLECNEAGMIDENSMGLLANSPNLEVLVLYGEGFSDKFVGQLSKISNITKLYLNFTSITDQALSTLKTQMPECDIYKR